MRVLIVGSNTEVTRTVVRLLNNMESYDGFASNSINEMLEKLEQESYDILLIGAGFDKDSEQLIISKAIHLQPDIKVLEHYGGGSGLLHSELEELKNKISNE